MNNQFANILQQCIDDIESGEKTPEECVRHFPEYEVELADILGVVNFIKNTPHEPVNEDFRWRTRATLVNQVTGLQPETFWKKSYLRIKEAFVIRQRMPRIQLLLIVVLLLALVSGGTVLASHYSVPGDNLYPLKLVVEEARLVISGEDKETDLYIQFAEKRLREVEMLAERGRYERIILATDRFEFQIEGATRSVPVDTAIENDLRAHRLEQLSDSIYKHQEILQGLLDDEAVAEEARGAIEHAIEASEHGQSKLRDLFPQGHLPTPIQEGLPIPEDPKPPVQPQIPVTPGPPDIPELPVELPVGPDIDETEVDEGGFPPPEPVEAPPGRP